MFQNTLAPLNDTDLTQIPKVYRSHKCTQAFPPVLSQQKHGHGNKESAASSTSWWNAWRHASTYTDDAVVLTLYRYTLDSIPTTSSITSPSIERLPEYSHMLRSVGIYVFSDVCTWHETRVRAVVPISIYLLWEIHWIFLLHLLAITMYGKNSYLFILVWT